MKCILLIWLLFADFWPASLSATLSERAFEEMLPENTLFYLTVPNVTELADKFKTSNGYKILREIDLIELMSRAPEFQRVKEFYVTFLQPLEDILGRRVAFAVKDVAPGGMPALIFLADVGDKEEKLRKYFTDTIQPILSQAKVPVVSFQQGEYEVKQFSLSRPVPLEVCYTMADGVFVATLGRGTIEELLGQPRREKSLAGNGVFQEARRRVGEKSDVLAYLNVPRVLEMVMGAAPAELSAVVRVLGLSSIKAAAFGAEVRASGLKQTVFLYTGPEREGLLRLFGEGGRTPKVVEYLPEDTTYFFSVPLGEFAQLWDEVLAALGSIVRDAAGDREWRQMEEGLKRAERRIGLRIREDILAPFAGEIGVAAKVPEALGFPAVYVLIEVKNAQGAEGLLKKVAGVLEKSGVRVVMTAEEHKGVTVTSFSILPPGTGKGSVLIAWLRPASAVVGDFLVIGLNSTLVKKIVDVHEGGPSLKDDPDFKRVVANLSGGGGMIAYANMKEVYDYLYSSFAGMAAVQLGPDLTAKLGRLGKYFGSAASRISSDEKGITYEAFSESGGAEQVWMQLVVAMFVPRFFQAKETAQSTMCINNLIQLARACILYANDHEGALPSKLSELYRDYVADLGVFMCPVSKKEISEATIDAVSDYELAIPGAKLGEIKDPGNTIMLLEKEPRHGPGRNVAYADGHVQARVQLEPRRPRPVAGGEKAGSR